jgi:hypothetical protein
VPGHAEGAAAAAEMVGSDHVTLLAAAAVAPAQPGNLAVCCCLSHKTAQIAVHCNPPARTSADARHLASKMTRRVSLQPCAGSWRATLHLLSGLSTADRSAKGPQRRITRILVHRKTFSALSSPTGAAYGRCTLTDEMSWICPLRSCETQCVRRAQILQQHKINNQACSTGPCVRGKMISTCVSKCWCDLVMFVGARQPLQALFSCEVHRAVLYIVVIDQTGKLYGKFQRQGCFCRCQHERL